MVTIPESYGVNRIDVPPDEDIHRTVVNGSNLTQYFAGNHWSIHPEWLYCRRKYKSYQSPESGLRDMLNVIGRPGWKWPSYRSPGPDKDPLCKYLNNERKIDIGFSLNG